MDLRRDIPASPAPECQPERQDGHNGRIPRFNPQIQGLRGLSALLVFVYHIYGMASVWGFWPPGWAALGPVLQIGQYGVEIFFVISGYLISQSLLRHGSAASFLADRALRVYPAFLVIHLLVFGLGPVMRWDWMAGISPGDWIRAFAENAALLPGVFNLPLAQKSAWSLSYELVFYLLAASSFVAGRRWGRGGAIAVAVIGAGFLLPLYPRAGTFLAGIGAFFVLRDAVRPAPAAIRVVSIPCFIATLALAGLRSQIPYAPYLAVFPAFFFFLSIVEGRCRLSAFLRQGWLQYFGKISYSFYLWAGIISYPIKLAIAHLLIASVSKPWIVLGFTALFLPLTILISDLSYRFIEIGATRWIRQRFFHPRVHVLPVR